MAAAGRRRPACWSRWRSCSRATSPPTSRRARSSRASTSCATRPASTSASCCSTTARATATCAPSPSAWRNTLRVALAGIVLASVLGVAVGLMRLSHHPLVAGLGAAYVEVFRNMPLLIQLLAIYLLITELLPDSSTRSSIDGVALLSKEGLQIAVPRGRHARAAVRARRPRSRGGAAACAAARRWLDGRRRARRRSRAGAVAALAHGSPSARSMAGRARCSTAS